MDLYVANATKQNIDFVYRVPGQTGIRSQPIAMGCQVRISGDLMPEEIDGIIEQHRKYGLISADEVKSARDFHGTCYSVGKPCPVGLIEGLLHVNDAALVKLGKQIREETAVASSQVLENDLSESGRPERLRTYEAAVIEEERRDGTSASFAEGVRVTRDEDAPRRGRRNARR